MDFVKGLIYIKLCDISRLLIKALLFVAAIKLLQAKTNYVKLRNGIYDCTGLIHKNEELKKKVKALLDSTYGVGKEVVSLKNTWNGLNIIIRGYLDI